MPPSPLSQVSGMSPLSVPERDLLSSFSPTKAPRAALPTETNRLPEFSASVRNNDGEICER